MGSSSSNNQENIDKGHLKIYIGIAIIIFSPLLGTLAFFLFALFVRSMISTDGAVEMFWLSCILSMAILGIALVIFGCNERLIEHKNKVDSR